MTLAISNNWSVASIESAELLSSIYGDPSETDESSLTWNCGKFKRIVLIDRESEGIVSD